MGRGTKAALKEHGYTFAEIPLDQQPRRTFYTRDKNTGEIVEMPNLPADPYSMERYLRRGFVLDKSLLLSQTVEQSQEGEFVCEVCGKKFTARIALAGHLRTHKGREENQCSVGGTN